MSRGHKTRLVRDVERCLKETGLPYSIMPRKKHWQITLAGECIGVLSYGMPSGVDGRNLMAIIKKKAEEHADRKRPVQRTGQERVSRNSG